MVPMPAVPRRVVTGHDARGTSVFVSDGPVPVAATTPGGSLFYELWATETTPAPIDAEPVDAGQADPAAGPLAVAPAPNGTKVRINELPPGAGSPMHRTRTVDYGIVLDGEVVLVLDDGETVLRAGDVVVQRGTNHRWENRSGATARVAFVLIDGAFTPALRDALGDDRPGGPPPGPSPAPGAGASAEEGPATATG
jgi:quercetin dioxygenase-like cupin family protein